MIESSGFAEFDRLATLFRRTRRMLDAFLATGDLPDGGTDLLANEALPHVEDVEAGFRAWLRVSHAGLTELRTLVLQGGLGPGGPLTPAEATAALVEAMQTRSGAAGKRPLFQDPARRLVALEHARLVFALLPRTREDDVHFPGARRSYADIAVPRSPGELAQRIEELERELWRLAMGRPNEPTHPAYRRTYGFFDTGERLSSQGFHAIG